MPLAVLVDHLHLAPCFLFGRPGIESKRRIDFHADEPSFQILEKALDFREAMDLGGDADEGKHVEGTIGVGVRVGVDRVQGFLGIAEDAVFDGSLIIERLQFFGILAEVHQKRAEDQAVVAGFPHPEFPIPEEGKGRIGRIGASMGESPFEVEFQKLENPFHGAGHAHQKVSQAVAQRVPVQVPSSEDEVRIAHAASYEASRIPSFRQVLDERGMLEPHHVHVDVVETCHGLS